MTDVLTTAAFFPPHWSSNLSNAFRQGAASEWLEAHLSPLWRYVQSCGVTTQVTAVGCASLGFLSAEHVGGVAVVVGVTVALTVAAPDVPGTLDQGGPPRAGRPRRSRRAKLLDRAGDPWRLLTS